MCGFKFIRAEHDDDEVERAVASEEHRQGSGAISVRHRTEIIEAGRSPAQPFRNDLDIGNLSLQSAGPTIFNAMTAAFVLRVVAPGQAVAKGQDMTREA